tara:strand:+ start:9119 stop:9568 length:450 start_codon:yes stop_codon:yes gene_type:complete
MSIKQLLQKEKITAMKSKNKERRDALTLVLAKIKQKEVDEQVDLTDNDTVVLSILDKMVKERKESIKMYSEAGRQELADKEQFEIDVIQEFLPKALSEEEVDALIEKAFEEVKPESIKQMGAVMGILKPQLQGRADMGSVSKKIRARLQ